MGYENLEKLSFKELIERSDVTSWEYRNTNPPQEDIVYEEDNYVIVRVVPSDDWDFEIYTETDEGYVVDWGELVLLTDSPYQSCYAIFKKVAENRWRCLGSLYYTLEEAKVALKNYLAR